MLDPVVYIGDAPCGTGTEVLGACSDAAGTSESMKVTLPMGDHYFYVDNYAAAGPSTVTVTASTPVPLPDTCASAIDIMTAGETNATLVAETGGANDDALGSCTFGGGVGGKDLIYQLKLTAPKRVTVVSYSPAGVESC